MRSVLHTLHTPSSALRSVFGAARNLLLGRASRRGSGSEVVPGFSPGPGHGGTEVSRRSPSLNIAGAPRRGSGLKPGAASILRAVARLLAPCSLLLAMAAPAATSVPEPTIVVVGTSYRSPIDSSDWAYLSWLASDPALLRDRSYAVYSKSGDADSANPYSLVSVVGVQVDPIVITSLFERSRHLGQDLDALRNVVAGYYRESNPAGSLGTAEMFSYLAATSFQERNLFQMLTLMGRTHPGAALALGTGFAAKLAPGATTFELRECVSSTGVPDANCTSVIGRVTVVAGLAVKLSAPAAPVKVPDVNRTSTAAVADGDIKGHLNVKLRWATPELLRRQSLLLRGYNVYRVTRSFAEARGWDVCPASAALLAVDWPAQVAANSPQVVRVNKAPILTRRFYTTTEATDFDLDAGDGIKGDLEFYTQDDNRANGLAFNAVGQPYDTQGVFQAGAQFYYYVVPVDLLGRHGTPSCGTMLRICDRDPPAAPKGVKVTNDFSATGGGGTTSQKLRIAWEQSNPASGDNVTAYYVYRWRSLEDMKQLQNVDPTTLSSEFVVAGPIAHVAGKATQSIVDDASIYSPRTTSDPTYGNVAEDTGRTIWYTVRAVDAAVCGANFSPNSAPAYGVLRDRAAPVGGGGFMNVNCCVAGVKKGPQSSTQGPQWLDAGRLHFNLTVTRGGTNPAAIVLAQFYLRVDGVPGEFTILTQEFPADPDTPLVVNASARLPGVDPGNATLAVRVYLDDGSPSPEETVELVTGNTPWVHTGTFHASRACGPVRVEDGRGRLKIDCNHSAIDPATGLTNPVQVVLEPAIGTREYRVYRTIDGGPLTLVRQGTLGAPAGPGQFLNVTDNAMIMTGATICYFVRYFDEHGNGGPLHELGCTESIGLPPPTPSLARPQPVSPGGVPKLKVKWFCPPPTVERFEVAVSDGNPASLSIADELTPTGAVFLPLFEDDEGNSLLATIYRTGIIGENFDQDGPEFSITLDQIEADITYRVRVRAVGKNGMRSPWSNPVEATWEPAENYVAPEVAWPARQLPVETSALAWDSRITAEYLHGRLPNFHRVGVRIGQALGVRNCRNDVTDPDNPVFTIGGNTAPDAYIFLNSSIQPPPGQSRPGLLPVMLYRYQVPNELFPNVSGDVVQVTPLIESIAAAHQTPVSGMSLCEVGWRIYDPYIAVSGSNVGMSGGWEPSDIWLLDSQPMNFGARYKYLLVVFNKSGEIRTVIPTNEVEIIAP